MKKRLAEGMTLMVLLLVLWNMAAHTDRMAEAQIKHFTAFFPTEGNSLEYGNIMKAKIAEVTGAECEELWLSGQTKEQALNSYIASGRYPDFIQGEKNLYEAEALIPIDEDILFMLDAEKVEEKKTFTLRSVLYLVSGIAASFLLLLGLNHLLNPVDPCFCSDNYVVINGRCYTDIHKVRSMALEALQEVATPADEYFPEADRDEADRMIIDNQLNELRSLFDDNE